MRLWKRLGIAPFLNTHSMRTSFKNSVTPPMIWSFIRKNLILLTLLIYVLLSKSNISREKHGSLVFFPGSSCDTFISRRSSYLDKRYVGLDIYRSQSYNHSLSRSNRNECKLVIDFKCTIGFP